MSVGSMRRHFIKANLRIKINYVRLIYNMFKEIDLNKSIHLMNVIATYKFRISCKKDRKKTQRKITDIIRSHHICWTHHEYDRAIGNSIAHGSCPVKCKIITVGFNFIYNIFYNTIISSK